MKRTLKVPSGLSRSAEELFVESWRLEERGDFLAAFNCLRAAAKLGDSGSQVNLGNYYADGTGIRKDAKKAAYWYARAYRNGERSGAHNLGIEHRKQKNRRAAVRWFRKAAAMNEASSMIELAKLYSGKIAGDKKAISLLEKVSTLDREHASEADLEEAAKLLRRLQRRQRKRE
jgi:TPR repeat protein